MDSRDKLLAGVCVLVVVDDFGERELLSFVLEYRGAAVVAVGSAEDALASLACDQPDVLVSDVGLPAIDGCGLIAELRRQPPAQGGRIPAVAITDRCGTRDSVQAIDAGFQVSLPKPVPLDTLVAVVAGLARAQRTAHGASVRSI
jgi:CheY-like chemotaxis protein